MLHFVKFLIIIRKLLFLEKMKKGAVPHRRSQKRGPAPPPIQLFQ